MEGNRAPNTVDLGMIDRERDVAYVLDAMREAECCSVVGVSNIGKSTLMRSLPFLEVDKKNLGSTAGGYVLVTSTLT